MTKGENLNYDAMQGAMDSIIERLDSLNAEERERVIRAIAVLYGLHVPERRE